MSAEDSGEHVAALLDIGEDRTHLQVSAKARRAAAGTVRHSPRWRRATRTAFHLAIADLFTTVYISVSQSRLFHKRSGQRWMEIAMSETQGTEDAATSEPKVGINPVPIFTGGDAGILSQPTDTAPDEES